MATALVRSQPGSKSAVKSIAGVIKEEMQHLCSTSHNSLLRDNIEAVKCFSWETVWLELERIHLFRLLLKRPDEHKPLICFLASAILKERSPRVCLVQRVISVLLYGNGTNKEVKLHFR